MNKILGFMVCILLFGCSKDDGQEMDEANFADYYGGKPFKGTAIGIRSQNGVADYRWEGEGTVALIESSADSVSMVLMADFDEEGEINLKMRGKVAGNSFLMEADDPSVYFRVIDEKINGNIANSQQDMGFSGLMNKGQTTMTVDVLFHETQGAFPKGASLRLQFDTRRETADDDTGSGCQMRMVPIWGPNGMTMGMVPDC